MARLESGGVPVKVFKSTTGESLHSKCLLVEGNHNGNANRR